MQHGQSSLPRSQRGARLVRGSIKTQLLSEDTGQEQLTSALGEQWPDGGPGKTSLCESGSGPSKCCFIPLIMSLTSQSTAGLDISGCGNLILIPWLRWTEMEEPCWVGEWPVAFYKGVIMLGESQGCMDSPVPELPDLQTVIEPSGSQQAESPWPSFHTRATHRGGTAGSSTEMKDVSQNSCPPGTSEHALSWK